MVRENGSGRLCMATKRTLWGRAVVCFLSPFDALIERSPFRPVPPDLSCGAGVGGWGDCCIYKDIVMDVRLAKLEVAAARSGLSKAICAAALCALFAASVSPAYAYDVTITTDQSSDVNLPASPAGGGTMLIDPGVSVAPAGGAGTASVGVVSNAGSVWNITNDGTVTTADGSPAILFSGTGTLTNAGLVTIAGSGSTAGIGPYAIEGSPTAINNLAGALISDTVAGGSAINVQGVDLTNAGTITGPAGGYGVLLVSGNLINASIINSGTISGGVAGIDDGHPGTTTIDNQSGGQILGLTSQNSPFYAGIYIPTGVQPGTGGVTVNITNEAGATISGGHGISSYVGTGTADVNVTNAGTIQGNAGMGISLPQGGTISNMPGGVIAGATTGISLGGNGSTVYNAGTITGSGGTAIDFRSQAAGALSSLTLDTGSVLNGNVLGGPGTNNLTLTGTNTEDISKFSNFQTLTMQGDDWTLNGNGAFSSSATVSSGTLHVNGVLTVPATTIALGGTLAGFGTVAGNVSNAGTVAPGSGITGSTNFGSLTISGNYVGAGGTLALNTYLGADNSPSDKLVINGGTATGTTSLAVTNAGGPGASSTANGIAVVQAINGGTTAAGAFSLTGEVRAGAYDYRLFQGGVAGSDPNDWFLRSTMVEPPVTPPPIPTPVTSDSPAVTSPENPTPVTPPDDLETVPPAAQSSTLPIIGPEIATYIVVQPLARQLGLTTLGMMHERIGDTRTEADGGAANEGWGHSGWVRLFGQQIDNRYQTFANASASGKQVGFEAGVDLWRGSFLPGHLDAAGVSTTPTATAVPTSMAWSRTRRPPAM